MIAVGIDPGVQTGVAVWSCLKQSFLRLETMDFWECYDYVTGPLNDDIDKLLAVVEDPGGNKPVFSRGQVGRKNLKIAQNVGMNKKEAQLLIEGIRRQGIPVKAIVPQQSKWTAETFNNITGHEGRSNEHQRDAGRMVFGMTEMPDMQYQRMLEELETK